VKDVQLLIDIGNSSIVSAEYFSGESKSCDNVFKFSNRKNSETKNYRKFLKECAFEIYESIVVSSVVPEIDEELRKIINIKFVNYKTIPEIKINLKKPEEVGADRLVNAIAVAKLYRGNCLVIDSGTAVTFCVVDKEQVYQGGAIFPGMRIASKALNLYTAKIPMIYVEPVSGVLGKSTEEAVQIGLYSGYINLINGFIAEYRERYADVSVIGTGKGLEVLKNKLAIDCFEPDLIIKGLAICADLMKG
jgi:type III pantothenate kinase